jgi:hypothetical protein
VKASYSSNLSTKSSKAMLDVAGNYMDTMKETMEGKIQKKVEHYLDLKAQLILEREQM